MRYPTPLLAALAAAALLTTAIAPGRAWAQQTNDPVKVFILAGQSNMVGHGKTINGLDPNYDGSGPREVPGGIGSLTWAVQTMPEKYGHAGTDPLVDANGNWRVRDDVNVFARMEVFQDASPDGLTDGMTRKGAHTVGFGKANSTTQKWNGPEYGFGRVVGDAMDQDVLIIKVATGGTSLKTNWRSPSAVAERGGEVGYMWPHMLNTVGGVLDNLATEFPEYAGRDHEIAGFGWHQGWNDRDAAGVAEYEANLRDLIDDVRSEFADAELPFVVANTGIGGEDLSGIGLQLVEAQNAVDDIDNVTVVDTRPMYRDSTESPSTFGYHWYHNGITHDEIGAGMGEAMVTLVPEPSSLGLLGVGAAGLLARRR